MNSLKIKVYERVLKEVSEKYEGTEQLRIAELTKYVHKKSCLPKG